MVGSVNSEAFKYESHRSDDFDGSDGSDEGLL